MAFQSIWYYTDLPDKVVDLITEDLTEKFDDQMADSKLHGDALNKEKRSSQNAWVPTTHWVGGFIWFPQIMPGARTLTNILPGKRDTHPHAHAHMEVMHNAQMLLRSS